MKKPALVIMAAGMGSRYGGIKQIEPVGEFGEVILDYSVYDAVKAGFGKIVFIIRKDLEKDFKEAVLNRIPSHIEVEYVFQELNSELPFEVPLNRTKPWGTAHAVLCAGRVIDGPFVVINADDYYGSTVFDDVKPFLDGMEEGGSEYAMAGYTLSNTLSEHGYVSRGVCKADSSGLLTSIIEYEKIEVVDGKVVAKRLGVEAPEILTGSEPASMNFFCLGPLFFGQIREALKGFLSNSENLAKTEIYLPILLDELINKEEATVKVIPTDSDWFGMTYKEDSPIVKQSFKNLIKKGVYPSPLWS
ncbi:MAG: nucleotidyltransferase [Spirochaetales bacterium]|nr:nucleotidyltransferase [Spirochaetales bacterium]